MLLVISFALWVIGFVLYFAKTKPERNSAKLHLWLNGVLLGMVITNLLVMFGVNILYGGLIR